MFWFLELRNITKEGEPCVYCLTSVFCLFIVDWLKGWLLWEYPIVSNGLHSGKAGWMEEYCNAPEVVDWKVVSLGGLLGIGMLLSSSGISMICLVLRGCNECSFILRTLIKSWFNMFLHCLSDLYALTLFWLLHNIFLTMNPGFLTREVDDRRNGIMVYIAPGMVEVWRKDQGYSPGRKAYFQTYEGPFSSEVVIHCYYDLRFPKFGPH